MDVKLKDVQLAIAQPSHNLMDVPDEVGHSRFRYHKTVESRIWGCPSIRTGIKMGGRGPQVVNYEGTRSSKKSIIVP